MHTLMLDKKDSNTVICDANKQTLIANVIREHNAKLYDAKDYVNEEIELHAEFTEIDGITSYSLCSLYNEITSIILGR